MGHRHFNGLKTAALFGVMWAVLLGIGWLLGGGTPKFLLFFTALGLVMTLEKMTVTGRFSRAVGAAFVAIGVAFVATSVAAHWPR